MGHKESSKQTKLNQTENISTHMSGLQIRLLIRKKYFLYFSSKTYVVGTQKNRLNETHVLIEG